MAVIGGPEPGVCVETVAYVAILSFRANCQSKSLLRRRGASLADRSTTGGRRPDSFLRRLGGEKAADFQRQE